MKKINFPKRKPWTFYQKKKQLSQVGRWKSSSQPNRFLRKKKTKIHQTVESCLFCNFFFPFCLCFGIWVWLYGTILFLRQSTKELLRPGATLGNLIIILLPLMAIVGLCVYVWLIPFLLLQLNWFRFHQKQSWPCVTLQNLAQGRRSFFCWFLAADFLW